MSKNNKQFKMNYSIGTNFDPELIEELSKYDVFTSVYGKLRSDIIGGGRASMALPKLSMGELEDYISLCHQNNIKFNYLLNPMCLDNKEFKASSHKKIVNYIEELLTIGADKITVNSPFLCELINKQFPEAKVTIGLYAAVGSLQEVKYWEELGADEITLLQKVNRNFDLLEKLLIYTKKSGIKLRVIANNVCLHHCPYQISHGTRQAHASQEGHHSKDLYIDHELLSCNSKKIKNPVKLIASEWIRPEDVKHYENLCKKTGNYNFSIKLVERTKTTDFLLRVVKAYANRSYEGNLLDLLGWSSWDELNKPNKIKLFFKALIGRYNLKKLKEYKNTLDLPTIHIDNKKLNGFLEQFKTNYKCNDKICDDEGRLNDNSKETEEEMYCSYCRKWAQKAIDYDQEEVEKWIDQVDDFLDVLRESKIFY